jgi:hypothetical protein
MEDLQHTGDCDSAKAAMDIDRHNYICSLIIDCAAYRIGGPAIHDRIISQNQPALQKHYPEQTWTPERVSRLFETNGVLDAIRPRRTEFIAKDDQVEHLLKRHADEIQLLLAQIGQILKRIKR